LDGSSRIDWLASDSIGGTAAQQNSEALIALRELALKLFGALVSNYCVEAK
jgi:hypothetical protein